jgi:hypothetical protein
MRFLALETDKQRIINEFCNEGEEILLITYYHGLSFLFAIFRDLLATLVMLALGFGAWWFEFPLVWSIAILFFTWLFFVSFNILRAFLDWCYDMIIVTTDKVIFIDQSSLFAKSINPIHVENIGGISTKTQYWNIFPFGILTVNLKEGLGGDTVEKRYVPRVETVASEISEAITAFQRRRVVHAYNPSDLRGFASPTSAGVVPPPETPKEGA